MSSIIFLEPFTYPIPSLDRYYSRFAHGVALSSSCICGFMASCFHRLAYFSFRCFGAQANLLTLMPRHSTSVRQTRSFSYNFFLANPACQTSRSNEVLPLIIVEPSYIMSFGMFGGSQKSNIPFFVTSSCMLWYYMVSMYHAFIYLKEAFKDDKQQFFSKPCGGSSR